MYPHYIPQIYLCTVCGKSRRWYNHDACSRQVQVQNIEKNKLREQRKKRKRYDADVAKLINFLDECGAIDGHPK